MASKDISTVDYTDTFNTFFVKDVDDIRQISKGNAKTALGIAADIQTATENKADKAEVDELKKILVIKCETEESETLNISDIADCPLQELHIYGKSTQDGEPTAENPVKIVSVVNPVVKMCGKNLLKINAKTQNINGIAVTANDDGTVLLNGTASKTTQITVSSNDSGIPTDKDLIFSGCPSGGDVSGYYLGLIIGLNGNYYTGKEEVGGGVAFNISDLGGDICRYVQINISANTVCKNLLFKPMISVEGGEYEPYTKQSQQFSYTLNGVGDVKDELIVYADGTGQLIQRIDSKITTQTTTADHSDCILAEPIVTELTAEQVKAYYPVTNIYTDTNGTLKVKYVADTKNYIDRKFDELATALVAQTSEQ